MTSLSFENLKALLLLNRLGRRKDVVELLNRGMTPCEVLEQAEMQQGESRTQKSFFASIFKLTSEARFNPEKEIEDCGKKEISLLTWFSPDYPAFLKEISDPPLVLYMKGQFMESDHAAVAIVGTRHPSFYGLTQTRKFSGTLAEKGMTIVSGFAKGVDQAAHQAAVNVPIGRTLAVLGCGIDVSYPKGSEKLFDAITEKGAVLTEYPLGTEPRAENFPRRNRIISGLSQAVLVIEAHIRSGSLITAHEAAEQGRQVFAVPGPVDQLTSRGAHRLIKEGAALAESAEDILEALAPSLWPLISFSQQASAKKETRSADETEKISAALNPEEQQIAHLLTSGPLAYDQIAGHFQAVFSAGKLTSLLTQMELQQKIHKTRDGRFVLK